MAITLLEGFEHGVFGNAGGGIFTSGQNYATYCSVVTSPVNNGTYALRMNPSAATLYWYKTVSSSSVLVASFYVRVATLAADINFCTVNITNSPGLAFDYIDASNFRIASTYGGILRQYSANLSYNTWYLVDLKIDFSSSGTIDFKVNGSAATQYSSGATGSYTQVNWGAAASGSCDYYLDDIMTSNSSGDYAFGAHKVVGYKPGSTTATSSPGSNIKDNGGTVINDSSNPAYVELDDVPLSGGSDYIQQDGGTSSIYAESYFEQTAETGTVKGVNAFVAYQSASASPANSASSKICDEDNAEQDIYTGDMSETSRFYKALILAAPSGGWDAGAVNALRFRCGYATDYAPVPRWHAAMIEVAFLVSTVETNVLQAMGGWGIA